SWCWRTATRSLAPSLTHVEGWNWRMFALDKGQGPYAMRAAARFTCLDRPHVVSGAGPVPATPSPSPSPSPSARCLQRGGLFSPEPWKVQRADPLDKTRFLLRESLLQAHFASV